MLAIAISIHVVDRDITGSRELSPYSYVLKHKL